MKNGSILALVLVVALTACNRGTGSAPSPAALPADVVLTAPGPDVPVSAARFAGVWEGTWGPDLGGKLAVRSVGADGTVDTVYAWGDHPAGDFAAGMSEVPGQVTDGVLRLQTFGNGANVSYVYLDNGSIEGRYVRDGQTSIGRFVLTTVPEAD